RPSRRAASATFVDRSVLPRPAGRGSRVTTSSTRWADSARASRDGTDQGALPRKTRRIAGLAGGPSPPPAGPLQAEVPLPKLGHGLAPLLLGEAVDEQHPVHVVGLVLEDPGHEALAGERDGLAVEVQPAHRRPQGPAVLVPEVRDGQAPLLLDDL